MATLYFIPHMKSQILRARMDLVTHSNEKKCSSNAGRPYYPLLLQNSSFMKKIMKVRKPKVHAEDYSALKNQISLWFSYILDMVFISSLNILQKNRTQKVSWHFESLFSKVNYLLMETILSSTCISSFSCHCLVPIYANSLIFPN